MTRTSVNPQYEIHDPRANAPQFEIGIPRFWAIPWAAGLGRRSVYDLRLGVDGYGRKIFIESEDEYTGRPIVWYMLDQKGSKTRCERGTLCVKTERLGASPYL